MTCPAALYITDRLSAIEKVCGPRLFLPRAVSGAVPLAPHGHRNQNWPKALPVPCERIFHARRHLCKHLAMDKAIPLKFSQMLGEHLLGRAGYQSLQCAESVGSPFKVKQNQGFPFSADYFSRELYRAIESIHNVLR
jgi:hypothetical protein